MTLDELFRRIVRAHLGLIAVCVLLPVAVVVSYQWSRPSEYEGRVRVQVINDTPMSTTQVGALSARVLALATTPELLRRALAATGQRADVQHLSEEDVATRGLGESPVVELTVVRGSAADARGFVSALATEVVDFMNEGTRAPAREIVSDIDEKLATAGRRRTELVRQLAAAGPGGQRSIQAEITAVQADVDRLNTLRDTLTVEDASRGRVVVIDQDSPQVVPVPSPLLAQGALALLLGVLLGTGLAVAIETLRPRLAGARGVARLWDGPVLGSTADRLGDLRATLELVARRQGLEAVVLLGVDDASGRVAGDLLRSLRRHEHRAATVRVPERSAEPTLPEEDGSRLRFLDLSRVQPRDERTAGVVLVSSAAPLRRDLERIEDLVSTMSWPVVGVLAAPGERRGR